MTILGIYVHLNTVHLSLKKESSITLESVHHLDEKMLSSDLPILIQDIIKDDIPNCIAIHKGPGGFTALRVSLALIQGLALGWGSKLFTPTHFEFLHYAYNIKEGFIVIDHNGAILPGVEIVNGEVKSVKPFSMDEAKQKNAVLTSSIDGINLSSILIEMAEKRQDQWSDSCQVEPYYGILPQYKQKNA
jgi:hypothetical protein